MHEFLSFNMGQLGIMLSILLAAMRLSRMLDIYDMEHEMLIEWYCTSHGIERKDLVTRRRRRGFLMGIFPGRRDDY